MKTQNLRLGTVLLLCIASVSGLLSAYVFAQHASPPAARSKLADAIGLLKSGKPQEARELIATIATNSADYPAGQCYQALCLYETKDYLGFLNKMESPLIKQAGLTPDVREELTFKHIDALFQYRKFDDALSQTESFRKSYAASPRLRAVAELRMASLFERGMKKIYEAGRLTDTNRAALRWTDGKTNLQEFLSLASSTSITNYETVKKHELKKDIWVARMTLGDQNLTQEEGGLDEPEREKLGFSRVQTTLKAERTAVDKNIRTMKEFLQQFPNSDNRKRVEFDLASYNFKKAEALWKEAQAAEQMGDTDGARAKSASARQYFRDMQSLQSQATADAAAGIKLSDILELRGDLLYGFYLDKDYARLSALTASMISESAPGELNWIMARVYDGIVLRERIPAQPAEAAAILDEVLAFNFKNKPDHDYYVLLAAKWRVDIALTSGDEAKARGLVKWVQDGNCTKDLKTNFLKSYSALTSPQMVESK